MQSTKSNQLSTKDLPDPVPTDKLEVPFDREFIPGPAKLISEDAHCMVLL